MKRQLALIAEDEPISTSAGFSSCRTYRYTLTRRWGKAEWCMFIGLNPSTADEKTDDPTIRKCIGYAKRWGFGGLCMLNLFAYRATDPREMKKVAEPVGGPDNDRVILSHARDAGVVVAAWGAHGGHMDRDREVMKLLDGFDVQCLRETQEGFPYHPLYLPGTLTPLRYCGRP